VEVTHVRIPSRDHQFPRLVDETMLKLCLPCGTSARASPSWNEPHSGKRVRITNLPVLSMNPARLVPSVTTFARPSEKTPVCGISLRYYQVPGLVDVSKLAVARAVVVADKRLAFVEIVVKNSRCEVTARPVLSM